MTKKKKISLACAFALLFLLLIVLVKCVDVQPIGADSTEIGLAGINSGVHELTGECDFWYQLTQGFGTFALALAGVFALFGAVQLIRRRSFRMVDRELYILAAFYALILLLYVFFEKVIINYRPVIMPGESVAEASFPSTHTMLVCTILGSAMLLLGKYIRNDTLRKVLYVVGFAVIILTVVGRLLSGVHWFTDILGSLLISSALLLCFSAALPKGTENAA